MENNKTEIVYLNDLELRKKIEQQIKSTITTELVIFAESLTKEIRYSIDNNEVKEILRKKRNELLVEIDNFDLSTYADKGFEIRVIENGEYLNFVFSYNQFLFIKDIDFQEDKTVIYDDYNEFLEHKYFENNEDYIKKFLSNYSVEIEGIVRFMLLEYISKQAKYIIEHKRFYFTNGNIGEDTEYKIKKTTINDFKDLDFSDNKGTEKIIMLHKLGVIDFLRNKEPFNTNTNALASVLSGITGEKQSTLQSYINPIINKNNDQKNNPLINVKKLNLVEQKLISIGFNITK